MSLGGIAGGIVGGIAGFLIGGPIGLLYGVGVGFSIGMMIDPMTPDMAPPGMPSQEIQVTTNKIGLPIPDLAGTGKLSGNLLCYGKERVEEVVQETDSGKGGGSSTEQITGYKYYASWALGICLGEIDALLSVYRNDEIIWSGTLERPASGGQESLLLDEMGIMTFYFGTNDQSANSKVGALIGDNTLNSPNRGLCWAFFDDCCIGGYNRIPSMKFVVRKIPEPAVAQTEKVIQEYDYNPVCSIWYILCKLTGLPSTWLYFPDFTSTAYALSAEKMGMSLIFDRQNSALSYLETINRHIDSIIRYGSDGKFHPKLIRDDYNIDNLPLVDETVLLEAPTFSRKSWIDTINEVKVQYTEIISERTLGYTLWTTGLNDYGQLGLGDASDRDHFTQVEVSNTWKKVSCGDRHTIAIDPADNSLWGAGDDSLGQLGMGCYTHFLEFEPIGNFPGEGKKGIWYDVSCGWRNAATIKSDGTLWDTVSCGFVQRSTDVWLSVSYGSGWGQVFYMAIKLDGTLWAVGDNDYGQLGLGDENHRDELTQVGTDDTWQIVICGGYHTAAIKSDGTLWTTGYNGHGQLGLGDIDNRNEFTQVSSDEWKIIACGRYHTMAIKTDKTLWAAGYNYYGQLGLGDTNHREEFTQVGTDDTWKIIACGRYHTMAIKTDKTLWAAGYNYYGQLGLLYPSNRIEFTQVGSGAHWEDVACGYYHTAALKNLN
ncbi:MAG: RCC1 domain-containing protein [Candidatus Asgardarchaeia archaeon]